jgi:hypothetical protein
MAGAPASAEDRPMTINVFLRSTATPAGPGPDVRRVANSLESTLESYVRDELLARETGLWL